jgi:AraC family transcriptional regulator
MTQKGGQITFGDELRKLEAGGFILTETFHPPLLALPRHDHENANINFTIKGSFREIIGSRPQESDSLSILVKPAGEVHANKYGSAGAHCLLIEVKPNQLETVNRFSKLFDEPTHIRSGILSALALRIYKEFKSLGSAAELMIEGLILEMLAESARRPVKDSSPRSAPRWLCQAKDFIHENFTEGISLSSIAAAARINPTYLARMFRKYYGCSLGEYVRRLQLEFAARELLKSEYSLAEIAAAAGFYDQSHFTNVFKSHTKLTPSEFRTIMQKRKD